MEKRTMFFSPRNKEILKANITRECQQQLPQPLGKQYYNRLDKALQHYMNEVWTVNTSQPLPILNREVSTVTAKDLVNYLSRPPAPATQAPVGTPDAQGLSQNMGTMLENLDKNTIIQPRPTPIGAIFQDTSRSLEDLQKERQGTMPERPDIPDFRITNEGEDGLTPMELYQLARDAREREAAAQSQLRPPVAANEGAAEDSALLNHSGAPQTMDVFRTILGPDVNVPVGLAPPPPIKTSKRLEETQIQPPPRIMDSMMLDVPYQMSGKLDTLVRQDSILQYKEREYNLFLNSMDRDWTKDNMLNMNRYNFTVNFDPSATSQSQNVVPFSQKKFKDIVRIQLIKIIAPRETLDIVVQRTDATPTNISTAQTNVLAFPSITVQVDELDGNNYGTNDRIDQAFGLVHYDAQWTSDPAGVTPVPTSTGITTNNGFVSLIPKFLNCQRVYEPTPLATLQKLSIRLERPTSHALLSDIPDVLQVANIRLGSGVATSIYRSGADPSSYIFVRTSTYFSKFMWETTDRVFFRKVEAALTPATTMTTVSSVKAIESYLNNEDGLLLVAIGTTTDNLVTVTDNANTSGYANVLVFQSRSTDPATTGSIGPFDFGVEADINTAFHNNQGFKGAGINSSHQVQCVFRIVTREHDPAAKLRPDNLTA